MATALNRQVLTDLLCHAWRHRWALESSQAVTIDGMRAWDDLLRCADGCGSSKTELRWNDGTKVKPHTPVYKLTPQYKAGVGYAQAEYVTEIRRRIRREMRSAS